MHPSTVDQWRAHLLVASLAATVIQAAVVGALLVFDVPVAFFASAAFRLGAIATIAAAVLLIRGLAAFAFRAALANHFVQLGGDRHETHEPVTLSHHCPRRALVVLHIRLNRKKFDSDLAGDDARCSRASP